MFPAPQEALTGARTRRAPIQEGTMTAPSQKNLAVPAFVLAAAALGLAAVALIFSLIAMTGTTINDPAPKPSTSPPTSQPPTSRPPTSRPPTTEPPRSPTPDTSAPDDQSSPPIDGTVSGPDSQ
jgi:hypothetical protein